MMTFLCLLRAKMVVEIVSACPCCIPDGTEARESPIVGIKTHPPYHGIIPLYFLLLSMFQASLKTVCANSDQVGLRGLSLALLALALQGWAVLVMLGVWGVRIAVARATEASDLKWTKVTPPVWR